MGIFGEFFGLFFGQSKGAPAHRNPPVCPSCQSALERLVGGKGCHRCPGCGGLWVTDDFLALALEASQEQIEAILGGRTGSHTFARSPQQRECPGCAKAMDNYPFGYQSGIWVDGCSQGHGVWLDAGELSLIRDYQARQKGPMSAQDRAKMAAAFLDGASTARRNILDAMPQPSSRESYGDPNY